jgi:rhodanese-related sulfurtransferase
MSIINLQPKEAFDLANEGTCFVDVREIAETNCNQYDLKNVTYLPLSIFELKFNEVLPKDKHIKIILACQAGGRSAMAATSLKKHGYTNVCTVVGGLSGWALDGFPVKNGENLNVKCGC